MSMFKSVGEYFDVLYGFIRVSQNTKRYTPSDRLLFRVLIEQGNLPGAEETMYITDEKLMRLTGFGSWHTLNAAKVKLKNLGLIDYKNIRRVHTTRYEVKVDALRELDELMRPKREEKAPGPRKEEKDVHKCARIERAGGERERGTYGSFRKDDEIIILEKGE